MQYLDILLPTMNQKFTCPWASCIFASGSPEMEKRVAEDEMVGEHHRCNGHELGQTPGDSEGQGSLACCSPWGPMDMTERGCTAVGLIIHLL